MDQAGAPGNAVGAFRRMLVWISGASAGLGAALAATIPFDAELVDISRRGGTPGTHHVAVDLANPDMWPLVEEDFNRRLATFDGDGVVFVHNAATLTPLGPAGAVSTAEYTRNVLLNSAAAQVLGHAFLRAVADSKLEQHLVMVSSGAGRRPHEGESSYCAGKAALDQWVRAVGLEQQRRNPGCRVISVAPGAIDTDMQAELRAARADMFPEVYRFRQLEAEGRLAKPEDVARTIWSLLDRDVANGAVLHVRDIT
ncbi:NAD(P)-dependent dehydrogenase (short-subunit alcohol dehydrogenase family) [Kribbella antiqua]|uniref:NAD(P)-dependent dehydrogenase (Short-subunit alcohol dehydrogenase family) n=1 Tax=Kribbella antiqua TaxID=2512217 RepID=A0A4R2IA42_9ACTN|nr:NAD(P)-dependent dehydrogenase (short-subunit alcohol dehydrogenase family) [Kribbella antiqua]